MLVISGATLGEETSLEKLVSEFVISKDIGKEVFQVRGRNINKAVGTNFSVRFCSSISPE